jgi:ribosomal protein S18 acetylase RimI-like enzyme
VDLVAVLAAYDEQIRREARPDGTGAQVERVGPVVRYVSPDADGWSAVIWSDLDAVTADATIAAQLAYFAGRRFEWKLYGHDRPADLGDRLRAAGFTAEEPESLMVAEIAALPAAPELPPGVTLEWVTDQAGVAAVVAVHEEVFGVEHTWLGRALTAQLAEQHRTGVQKVAALLAVADGRPVSAGRVEFHGGTEFASVWGGGTLPKWRGRGLYRALVAARAARAAQLGYRYLQVDAGPESQPILWRLGFVELTTTTPFMSPADSSSTAP